MQFLSPKQSKKAIVYYRHSAEDKQENSVPIQREHATKFASQNNIEIIYEAADEGKTGLTSDRKGFESLFNDFVSNPEAPSFDYVLVYDVTRWGRWQNLNAPAHYEFLFEEKGKKVIYVSRGFPKEGQHLLSHFQTTIERYMAAEYSRQLSDKVWHGCMRVAKDGYSAGGTACYGMGRLLLDESKKPIRILNKGEHKMISNQRVTFTPLNDSTTQVVKDIFHYFINDWLEVEDIVEILNEKNIPSANGGKWNKGKVIRILQNETYTGSEIYNKTSGKLKQKHIKNPRQEWAIATNAFPAIINMDMFWRAQEMLFWSNPRKWKRGIHIITKSKKFIENELKDLLLKQGLDEDESEKRLRKIPLIFTINYNDESTKKNNLFVIEEPLRNHEKVIGVSISLHSKEIIEDIFIIPTSDFNECNFLLMSGADKTYSEYKIPSEKIYDYVFPLLEKIK